MENKALNIKALRQKAKLSVQQLSDKTGISAGWLYSMENGVMSDYPCDNVLQVSAESLGCSAIDLLAADSKDKYMQEINDQAKKLSEADRLKLYLVSQILAG